MSDDPRDLATTLALGIEDDGRAAVDALDASPEARAAYRRAREVSQALALGWDDVPPPEGLEARMVAAVSREIALRTAPHPAVVPIRRERPSWRPIALAAAGLAVIFGGLAAATGAAWLSDRDEARDLRAQLTARSIQLDLRGEASGTIFVSKDFSGGVIVVRGLPAAPGGHHYEVWSHGPDGTVAATSFAVRGDEAVAALPALPRTMTRMFVTLEPDGASTAAPTGAELLATDR